jgi:hypothetical protein
MLRQIHIEKNSLNYFSAKKDDNHICFATAQPHLTYSTNQILEFSTSRHRDEEKQGGRAEVMRKRT